MSDSSSSDDELDLATVKANTKKRQATKKKVAVKKEPKKAATRKTPLKKSAKKETKVAVKREVQKFEMPGQRKDTPDELDSMRMFYESLLEERPDSIMARKWCMLHGMLSEKEAAKALREFGGRANVSSSPKKKPASSRTAKKPAKKAPAKKPPAKRKTPAKKTTAKKRQKDYSSDSASSAESDSEEDEPLSKKKKGIMKAQIEDSSDSDDDVPLSNKKK